MSGIDIASGVTHLENVSGRENGKSIAAVVGNGRCLINSVRSERVIRRYDKTLILCLVNSPIATHVLLSDLAPLKSTPNIVVVGIRRIPSPHVEAVFHCKLAPCKLLRFLPLLMRGSIVQPDHSHNKLGI